MKNDAGHLGAEENFRAECMLYCVTMGTCKEDIFHEQACGHLESMGQVISMHN